MALKLGCSLASPRPARLIAVGFPTEMGHFEYLRECRVPKYFLQSTQDVHGPRLALEAAFAGFAEPKSLEFIEASDHFFGGSLQGLEDAVAGLPR